MSENNEKPIENEQTESAKFEKNIKTLWIYTTLFCLFALALIVISSIIQGKINSKAAYYQEQFENEKTSGQSTIKNISDENNALKRDIEKYKAQSERMTDENTQDAALMGNASELIINAEYLLKAQSELYSGKRASAKKSIQLVNADVLSEDMLETYQSLCKKLGVKYE